MRPNYLRIIDFTTNHLIRKDLTKNELDKPSKRLIFVTSKFLDFSNKQLVKLSKKDKLFRYLINGFDVSIQISTQDGKINRYLIFDGNGGCIYRKGKLVNPDASAIYTSVKDLFLYLKYFGDLREGIKYNRLKLKGNMNVLLKLEFLTNYFNPNRRIDKSLKQEMMKLI